MLRLRPYKKCDAKHIVGWIGDEYAFRQWCADRYDRWPITADDINAHYEAFAFEDNFYPMTAFDDSGVVGHMILRFTDEAKETARFGFVIVDDSRRGMGYGKAMLSLAKKYAFELLGARKITLGVFANNPGALKCYEACGFREVPQKEPEYFDILGESWECVEMELEPNN